MFFLDSGPVKKEIFMNASFKLYSLFFMISLLFIAQSRTQIEVKEGENTEIALSSPSTSEISTEELLEEDLDQLMEELDNAKEALREFQEHLSFWQKLEGRALSAAEWLYIKEIRMKNLIKRNPKKAVALASFTIGALVILEAYLTRN